MATLAQSLQERIYQRAISSGDLLDQRYFAVVNAECGLDTASGILRVRSETLAAAYPVALAGARAEFDRLYGAGASNTWRPIAR